MWRAAICFSAALVLGFPAFSHAQYNDNDRQNLKEYTDEDSQPLAIIADVLYPIGFAAEWLFARPVHYLASESPISGMYRPVGGNDNSPPPPVPVIPDNTLGSANANPPPQDWTPTKIVPAPSQPATIGKTTLPPSSAYSSPPPRQSQMH